MSTLTCTVTIHVIGVGKIELLSVDQNASLKDVKTQVLDQYSKPRDNRLHSMNQLPTQKELGQWICHARLQADQTLVRDLLALATSRDALSLHLTLVNSSDPGKEDRNDNQVASAFAMSLEQLKRSTSIDSTAYAVARSTLRQLCVNIIQHPLEEKYRRIRLTNAIFHSKLGQYEGSRAALEALGFQPSSENAQYWVLIPTAEKWTHLNAIYDHYLR